MVSTADIVMIAEIVLLMMMTFGSYYGRKLNMNLHHKLIYFTIAAQIIIFIFWMGPSITFWNNTEEGISVLLFFHMIIGSITVIASLVLCFVFLSKKNDYDLITLRWTKPLMILTFILWILSFILGTMFYIQVYILNP